MVACKAQWNTCSTVHKADARWRAGWKDRLRDRTVERLGRMVLIA